MTVAARGFGIGQPVRRVEDRRFITGRGRYIEDLTLPRQAYGQIVLSPHAHARIRNIDTARALAAPGVICVLTVADLAAGNIGNIPPNFMPEDMGGPKGYRAMRRVLASDRVRHVGERVAFVVAETAAQARDAAELLEVDYEPLPAVTQAEEAAAAGGDAGRGGGGCRRAPRLGRSAGQPGRRLADGQQAGGGRGLRQSRAYGE